MDKAGLYDRAQKHIQKGQWHKATELMEQVHRYDGSDALVTLRLGDLYKKLGMGGEAAGYYNKTADLYAGTGQKTKAAAIYKMILRMAPGMSDVQRKLDALSERHEAQAKSAEPAPPPVAGSPAPVIERIERHAEQPPAADAGPMEVYYGSTEKPAEKDSGETVHDTVPGLVELGSTVGRFVVDERSGGRPGDQTAGIDLSSGGQDVRIESFAMNKESSRRAPGDELGEGLVGGTAFGLNTASPPAASSSGPAPELFTDFASDIAAQPASLPSGASAAAGKEVEFLTDLAEDELWDLLGRMDRLTFGPGEMVIREGEAGDSIYIISSGKVMVSTTKAGMRVKLAELSENDFFGEVSFLTGKPRTADITAMETTTVMVFARHEMDSLIDKYPNVEKVLRMFQKERVADTIATIKVVSDLW